MKLKQLIKDIEGLQIKGSKEIDIFGLSSHSKTVGPGYLFVAKRGQKNDGNMFVPDAIKAGAVAVLSDLFDPSLQTVTQIICSDVAAAEALFANRFYQDPASELYMVGVTGTNGKTTTTYAIKHLFDKLGKPAGLIGTIEYMVGKAIYAATRTTPEVISNYKMLREMVKSSCKACAMEVTSHALDQGRVAGIDFDLAIFTNFSHEHLDYHKTLEAYAAAKNLLFRGLKPGSQCLANADDPWMDTILAGCPVKPLTYGIEKPADIMAESISFSTEGSSFTVWYQDRSVDFFWPLIGRFNVYNALAVIGCALLQGVSLDAVAPLMASFKGVPGRLERVVDSEQMPLYPAVFVDYSHKPEALKNVLQTLRECTRGRLITVFGCGGDRDREKRPLMGKIAEELSDAVFVTSDNPRSEIPEDIAAEIVRGFSRPKEHQVILDRKEAIEKAVSSAHEEDVVLIAGKGHELTQQFQHHSIAFDDREVARRCLGKMQAKVYDAL